MTSHQISAYHPDLSSAPLSEPKPRRQVWRYIVANALPLIGWGLVTALFLYVAVVMPAMYFIDSLLGAFLHVFLDVFTSN